MDRGDGRDRPGGRVGALRAMAAGRMEDRAFYREAFAVPGQDGFEDSFADAVQRLLLENTGLTPGAGHTGLLSEKTVARFNAICLVSTVKNWLDSAHTAGVDELVDAYLYLVSHSTWI